MQIEKSVGEGEQGVVDIGDDLLRRRAKRVAGKRAVEIEVVERGGAAGGGDRGQIDGGDENETPRHDAGIERAE